MIVADKVSKNFSVNGAILVSALDGASLHVDRGEFVTLIGPSGCGKSTLLNLICGLMEPDSGTISLDGDAQKPRLGQVGYMLQRDLLLPWRSLIDNLVLGPEVRGQDTAAARKLALELLPLFGLEGFADAYPSTLSMGMRQRAALLRTILCGQELLLLDEPFGALDALTRRTMRTWLLTVQERLKHTILFVTHDVDEAIFLADRVYVMSARPGHVILELLVDLPRPRAESVVAEPVFSSFRSTLLQALGVWQP